MTTYRYRHPIEHGYIEIEAETKEEAIERIKKGEGTFHNFDWGKDYKDSNWVE